MAVCLGRQLSKLAARISEPLVKCLQRHALQEHTTQILIYFCRKFSMFTKFYELMLPKVLKFASYAVAMFV